MLAERAPFSEQGCVAALYPTIWISDCGLDLISRIWRIINPTKRLRIEILGKLPRLLRTYE